jgi:subtilisin family serine protease
MEGSITRRLAAATLWGAFSFAVAPTAQGQVALPQVPVDLATVQLPLDAGSTLPAVDVRVGARQARLRNLLRVHRAELDRDPRGELIVREEILAFAPAADALQKALAAGFTIRRQRALEGIDASIVVLQPPAGLSMRRALQRLRSLDRAGVYDFNHVYLESGTAAEPATVQPAAPSRSSTPAHGHDVKLGLIDGGLATAHPALAGADIHRHGCNDAAVPTLHGTAVAALLVGGFPAARPADARRVQLFAADIYCAAATGGAVDAVVEALAWMLEQRVPVVNVSLVGPPNALLERVVALVIARGQTIVAAVGNDGPAAAPLYPAAYRDVIAVTAVDRNRKVLLEAGRGRFVDFAAPGADFSAAAPPDGVASVRGTSFAAPIVAGLLARQVDRLDKAAADAAVLGLSLAAVDLGARGLDPVYGHGLVGHAP